MIKLWTIQTESAYKSFLSKDCFTAEEDKISDLQYNNWKVAYDWLTNQMQLRIGSPPPHIKYPMWAWYQWEGIRKKPDMRTGGYAPRGTVIYRVEFEIPDKCALLSDFDLWYLPLCGAYLSLTESEDQAIAVKMLSMDKQAQNELKQKSWERVFDLSLEPNEWAVSKDKSIQATLWEIKSEQILKIEKFLAK